MWRKKVNKEEKWKEIKSSVCFFTRHILSDLCIDEKDNEEG